jgi:hypothetical protein
MALFGRHSHHTRSSTAPRRSHRFRKDPDRVAGGFKAALNNPNTTKTGRKHAKAELRHMGRGREAHVSLMDRVRRTLGIRKTPRAERHHTHTTTHTTRTRRRKAY